MKEIRLWVRDPRRGRFLRIALWTGVFTSALPALAGWNALLPWTGVVMVLFASAFTANLYGLDAGALWLTVLAPNAYRPDVRARQVVWLMVVGLPTVAFTLISQTVWGDSALWPLILSVLFSLIGAGAGLVVALSTFAPAPFPDKPGGNPLDGFSDESAQQSQLLSLAALLSSVVLTLPALALVIVGMTQHDVVVQWSGVAVAICVGCMSTWALGRVAYRRLQRSGPELVDLLRGKSKSAVRSAAAEVESRQETASTSKDLSPAATALVALLVNAGILLVVPQGFVALGLDLADSKVQGWFLALHFGGSWRILACITFVVLGAACFYLVYLINTRWSATIKKDVDGLVGEPAAVETEQRAHFVNA